MINATSKIFINYRREDTSGYSGRIFDSLSNEFGEDNIFIDVTKINTGTDYTEVITQALDKCNYCLILIGNTWLTCKDSAGNYRIDNPEDFVRKEIKLAIARKIKIIPILLEDARMPSAKELPADIQEMCKWQAIEITDSRWKYDIEKLIKSINLGKSFLVVRRKWRLPVAIILILIILLGVWKLNYKGIINNALTPKDSYHNARISELNGDFVSAQKSYKDYLKFNLPFIDPHLSYQSMLKSQEGINATRQEYKRLLSGDPNSSVIQFANALLMDRDDAISDLLQLTKKDSAFAPAFYQLSLEYSQDKLGERSLTEKSLEQTYLLQFLHLDSLGNNQKYYLDKTVAEQQVKDATTRLKQAGYATAVLKNQVAMIYMLANDGWRMFANIAEQPTKIYYRFNNDSSYHVTGLTGYQNSGKEIPDPNIFLGRLKNGQYPVSIKYLDAKGEEQGPFNFVLDTRKERMLEVKRILSQMNWVSFQKFDDKQLVYFTAILSYRDVFKEIKYSIDNQSLSKTFRIEPWTKGGIPEMQSDIYIDVPIATKNVCVKILFTDDSESELKCFNKNELSN